MSKRKNKIKYLPIADFEQEILKIGYYEQHLLPEVVDKVIKWANRYSDSFTIDKKDVENELKKLNSSMLSLLCDCLLELGYESF